MKFFDITFYSILILLFFNACGGNPPKASTNIQTQHYISQTDEHNQTYIKDIRQELLFTNSYHGCKALHEDIATALEGARTFCENLDFAGFEDWRVPTLQEIQTFSRGMDDDGLVPYFTFPRCTHITGIKTDGTLGTINTHNASPKFQEIPLTLPAGVRCTRSSDTL